MSGIQFNKGKIMNWAMVTGASAGIGKEFCEILAARKWNLVLVARRESILIAMKQELESKYQIQVKIERADLVNPADVKNIIGAMEKYNVTYLVNNAGMVSRGNFDERPLEETDRLMALNVTSLVHLTHGAIRYFKKLNAACYILNVGSVNSYISTGGQAVYCGSKAFVKSFTLAVADELKDTKIRISCLCPGPTDTEIMDVAGAEITDFGKRFLMTPKSVALYGLSGVERGRLISVPGLFNKISAFLPRIMPEKLLTRLSSRALKDGLREKISS